MSEAVDLNFEKAPSALAYMLRGAMPASRRVGSTKAIVARWNGHRASHEELSDFLRITGLPSGPTLPLLYPHTFGFRLSMAVLTSPAFPVPIWSVLQTRNHLLQHRPIPVDALLDFETRVHTQRVLEKGLEIDLHTEVRVAGELAWESVVTFYARGRFGAAGRPSPLAIGPVDFGESIAEWTMRDDAHWRFGRFTGDYNGIHCWDFYARRFGFARALYHPPRVLAECLAKLSTAGRLDAWLKGPVPHGASVRLHALEAAEGTTFALHAPRDNERPSIVGKLTHAAKGMRLIESRAQEEPS